MPRRSGRRLVEDPRDPTRMINASTLRDRTRIPDLENGGTISLGALRKQQQVRSPETGEMVTRNQRYHMKKVKDPVTGEMIARSALAWRKAKRRAAGIQDANNE
jgi:hypothetical protein